MLQRFGLVHVQLHPKAEISPHNRSQCEHESHSLNMAMLLLFLPLAYEVWIETHARIIHKHMAIYFTDVHFRDLAGENISDCSFEAPRNANILSEMIRCARAAIVSLRNVVGLFSR